MKHAISAHNLTKRFSGKSSPALDGLHFQLPEGQICGIVGPDGAGKTTLIRLMAGLLSPDQGSCHIFGVDSAFEQHKLHAMIGYMPQRFGLYEELTVKQNIALYSDLQGIGRDRADLDRLLSFAALKGFTSYLARDLSGGMKQKLGLICSLLRKPQVLLLDEPTVGVDPLSRKELWRMIEELREQKVTIVWSTSYLDEAGRCDCVLLLNQGRVLFEGEPVRLTERLKGKTFFVRGKKREILDLALKEEGVLDALVQGDGVRLVMRNAEAPSFIEDGTLEEINPNFEDAFVSLLGGAHTTKKIEIKQEKSLSEKERKAVVVSHFTKMFGQLKAVDDLSFEVKQGEIFGLIGPNGAGKSTTFKTLLGLLHPTSGETYVAGISMERATSRARGKIGYMAQKFSLYENMTVAQNLRFFAGVYSLKRAESKRAFGEMVELFELEEYLDHLTGSLPLGIKQRLALSCCLMHGPEVLFLDEPTSGVDPLTRREFWYHINTLAQFGVTILVSTHFMEEAEYCDRIGIIHEGKLRALDTADRIKARVQSATLPNPTLEDAFIELCSVRERGG